MEAKTRGARGKYAKSAQRREEILATAIDVFAAEGYTSTSFREIASRVGMSETGVFHHFGGKRALLEAVLEQRRTEDASRFGDPDKRSIRTDKLTELVAHNSTRRGLITLYAKLTAEAISPEHPAHEHFGSDFARLREITKADLDRLALEGQLDERVDREALAVIIPALMEGLQIHWLYDENVDMVAAFDLALRALLAYHPEQ